MSSTDLWQKFLGALRRRWADVLASDLAAGDGFEPELPASAFVRLDGKLSGPAAQAAHQRSASISSSKG